MDESKLTEVFCYQVSMAAMCVLRNEATIHFAYSDGVSDLCSRA